jgi:hypothetical protein
MVWAVHSGAFSDHRERMESGGLLGTKGAVFWPFAYTRELESPEKDTSQ